MRDPVQKPALAARSGEREWTGASVLYVALGLLPWLVMASLLFSRLGFAAADIRQLQLAPMGVDEAWIVGEVKRTLDVGKPLIWHIYPDLYFLVAWVPLYVWKAFHTVTTANVIVCLRLVSLLCFVMVGVFSTLGIARLRGARDGFLFSLLFFVLCVTPELATRSTACQPDLMNLCVFMAVFLCGMELVRRPTALVVALCGIVAGAGMAVKFSTVPVLPALALVIVLHAFALDHDRLWLYTRQSARANRWIVFASFTGLVLLSAVAWFAFRRGSSLGWLPTPAGISNAMGMTAYLVGALALHIVLMVENRLPMPQTRLIRSVLFVGHKGLLMALTFIIAFYLGAPNQWFHLRFLREMGFFASVIATAGGASQSLVRFHFWEVAHPAFLAMALVGGLVAILTWWRARKITLVTDEALAVMWSVTILLYFLFGIAWTRERYLYPAYPALVCLAWIGVRAALAWFQRWPVLARWAPTVTAIVLLVSQAGILGRENSRNRSEPADVQQLNGFKVGRWLFANASQDASILYSFGAYIPLKFSNIHIFGWGDPFEHLKRSRAVFVVVGDAAKECAARASKDSLDPVFLVSPVRSLRFYTDLENGSLGFRPIREFRKDRGRGFVVYKRDGTSASELKMP